MHHQRAEPKCTFHHTDRIVFPHKQAPQSRHRQAATVRHQFLLKLVLPKQSLSSSLFLTHQRHLLRRSGQLTSTQSSHLFAPSFPSARPLHQRMVTTTMFPAPHVANSTHREHASSRSRGLSTAVSAGWLTMESAALVRTSAPRPKCER
jgi:hypothetical protein